VTRELWRDCQVSGYGHGSDGKGGGWPGLRQVVMVRTTRELAYAQDPQPLVEEHYYLTSLPAGKMDGVALLELVRAHWLIENELHHVKDRTMAEDAQRHRPGCENAARLRSLAVGLFRWVDGENIPDKQSRLRAKPSLAQKVLQVRRKPKLLL